MAIPQIIGTTPCLDPDSRYIICRNDILNAYDDITEWRSLTILVVGASVLGVGLLAVIIRYCYETVSIWLTRLSKPANAKSFSLGFRRKKQYPKQSEDLSAAFDKVKKFSFGKYDSLPQSVAVEDGRMQIVPISEEVLTNEVLSRVTTPKIATTTRQSRPTNSILLASVDLHRLSFDGKKSRRNSNASSRTSLMNEFRLDRGLHGLILCHRSHDTTSTTETVLKQFREQSTPVILQADADSELWDTLDYALVDGVVVENACMMRNGERRDFFRASRVRDVAAQTKELRKNRPSFFFAFLETYECTPTAAVLRRAHKLADFFGALLETRDATPDLEAKSLSDMPLSHFDALKDADITWLQKTWSSCVKFDSDPAPIPWESTELGTFELDLATVEQVIPNTQQLLIQRDVTRQTNVYPSTVIKAPEYDSNLLKRKSIWEYSSCGTPLAAGGCFALREEIVEEQYSLILRMQKSLKERRMLQLYGDAEVLRVSESLKTLQGLTAFPVMLKDLITALVRSDIKILAGLDSGFTLPDSNGHVWGVMDSAREETGRMDIHISLKAANDVATIWHVYLAHRGVSRLQRFEEEILLTKELSIALPVSLARELSQSAESELLYLMQQLQLTESKHPFQDAIMAECDRLLIQDTSRRAWIALHSRACLDKSIGMRQLLDQRLNFFIERGATRLPDLDDLCTFATAMQDELERAALHCDRKTMTKLSSSLLEAYGHAGRQYQVTPLTDLYGLIFFCALRRLAFENVYLETTDRCPFFLSQPDQAAVFSELWVLGSQCEIYFGMLPRALGEITYNRYRQHLLKDPPGVESWDGKEVFTAYGTPPPRVKSLATTLAGKVPEQSPEDKAESPRGPPRPAKYREAIKEVGALSIFCVPAIVDVTLLCFVGRGLYLTAFFGDDVVKNAADFADYAILAALLLTSGVTGWVGSSGGFYLFNYAFDNMVHFLIHRFSGAIMLTTGVAICGFFGFGAQFGWLSGLIFALYLFPLSIFLTLLGIFATMHRTESPLPSGRMSMWKLLPILLISPIVTTFVPGWDLLIYLLVVYTFTFALLWEFRRLCHAWTNWHLKIPSPLKEADLLKWFKEKSPGCQELDSIALATAARSALLDAVHAHNNYQARWIKKQQEPDEFVSKISHGLQEALFLLRKECAGSEVPEIFTTTWFVQLDLALNNQRQLMRGLREHSAFINYRYSRYDIAQNVGLFMAALLDRLVQIVMSAREVVGDDTVRLTSRYSICFALLYFLCGALSVDIVLQRYWAFASAVSKRRLAGVADLDAVLKYEEGQRRLRYYRAILELASLLLCSFGAFTILLWLFVQDEQSRIIFFAYISSYTAVLLCQFHRCFTKSHRLHVITVFACCLLGLIIGCILRGLNATADWPYVFVVSQNVACLSALIGTAFWIFYNPNVKAKELDAAANGFKGMDKAMLDKYDNHKPATHGAEIVTEKTAIGGIMTEKSAALAVHAHSSTCNAVHQVNKEVLESICLEIDVNTKWLSLHEEVRKLIVRRLLGRSMPSSSALDTWSYSQETSINTYDQRLRSSLTTFDNRFVQLTISAPEEKRQEYELTSQYARAASRKNLLARAVVFVMQTIDSIAKWIAIIGGGSPDTPRELWYALRAHPLRSFILWTCLKFWKICWWSRIISVHVLAVTGKPTLGPLLDLIQNGARRILRNETITIDTPTWRVTGFIYASPNKELGMIMYDGVHCKAPASKRPTAVAYYDQEQRLQRRQDIRGPLEKPVETKYLYSEKSSTRWPISKITIDGKNELTTNYDSWGRPINGEIARGDVSFAFQYFYKTGSSSDSEVLYATYKQKDGRADLQVSVYWCVRPRNDHDNAIEWIASEKVQNVTAVLKGQTYYIRWIYKHAQGAEIEASMLDAKGKRRPCLPPVDVMENKFNFLTKPKDVSFDHEDLLIYHPASALKRMARRRHGKLSKLFTTFLSSATLGWLRLGEKVVFHRLSTASLRTALWSAWAKAPYVDAVTASFLDEMILRKEALLDRYWRLRDAGYLSRAVFTLDENLEQIISAMEPTHESSDKCPLLIKSADLFVMGVGKDATQLTARPEDAYRDTDKTTSVIFSDNGCWPDNPGGVSNCRRDLVNGHTTIKGHCLAESANDFGIPRYQIERNIHTLKVLPLWGLDGKTAHHGLFDNLLQTQVDDKISATKLDEDIQQVFVPLLRAFILGARSRRYTRQDLIEYSNVILKMNKYFETCDYNKTWNSELVWRAWLDGWLHDYNDANVRSPTECFDLEQPSLSDFRDALNLYICYFFIYSVQVPEDCPKVFQSTHHGISSLFGMLLKYRRGTTWGLWDHAILWRETCLNISPAQCLLPLPVQSMLLAGVKLACHLAYTHVDIVLPCTSVFNPDWEADLGTDQGLRGSKRLFNRKIDPIVNGIGNMDSFQPVEVVRSKLPTTVMLSNVQFIKDVKTAVLAADVIINKYGFTDYRLIIYGAQDRQPSYALETVNLINSRGLAGKVVLGGFGRPSEVLKDAWLFVNSSLSEGLPLAIGEAALSGVPIVATEVGATSLVLTDPDNASTRYGEVVPPNDPESLARAQLSILSMSGPWAKYTKSGEVCRLPDAFDKGLVKKFTERMYAKADDRRALGLKLRDVVLRSFHGHRYLRQHSEMFWIQRRRAEFRRSPMPIERHPPVKELYGERRIFTYDHGAEDDKERTLKWQLFEVDRYRKKRENKVGHEKQEAKVPDVNVVELGEK